MTLNYSWKTSNLPGDVDIIFSLQVLQPQLKNIEFVRVPDLGWTPATYVQIWILVDL